MSGIWGNKIQLSIFGESHGPAIGITITGLPAGFTFDMESIRRDMQRRAPGKTPWSTARQEGDQPEILSGLFQGKTTGAPLCCIIANQDHQSGDYEKQKQLLRPGHSDYPAYIKYKGFQDYRGGGHFSGRLTAPLVFAGALCRQLLLEKGIVIGAHIAQIGHSMDQLFDSIQLSSETLEALNKEDFPVLDQSAAVKMQEEIATALQSNDSIGGIIECAAVGIPCGVGDPFFDSVESTLSHLLFSIPAVKGVEFGDGFELAAMTGTKASDGYCYRQGKIQTISNHNGGILGGLTTGMPLIFRIAIKPTPSIAASQPTVNLQTGENTEIKVTGRHDPCIVPRAVVVAEAVCALALCQWV